MKKVYSRRQHKGLTFESKKKEKEQRRKSNKDQRSNRKALDQDNHESKTKQRRKIENGKGKKKKGNKLINARLIRTFNFSFLNADSESSDVLC